MEEDTALKLASSVYIPIDRRYAMAKGKTLPERTTGSALFADISGFTTLTEALAHRLGAHRGAEELLRHLNRVYDALITVVNHYGGSVIGFAGDAITCWFDQSLPPQAVANPAQRATACALACQRTMEQFAAVALPGGETISLAVKVAVASGQVRRFRVGDPEFQLMDTLAGQTLVRMSTAEGLADKGQIVVDRQTLALLSGEVRARDMEENGFFVVSELEDVAPAPWPPLPPENLSLDQIRPWVLPAVYDRLAEGLGEFLTELRPAVALFLRFSGIDYDEDQEAGAKLDACIRWVQGVLAVYEGTLIQLTIGDKGSYLYAVFGAPIAHEDDAQRAVSAAHTLRTSLVELGFIQQVHIGISQGTMRTGAYGGTTRRTYGLLGDEANVAARLMMHVTRNGEVLVSKPIRTATALAFAWQSLPPIRIKGKQQPIPAARLMDKGPAQTIAASYTTPLVGRVSEMAELIRFFRPILGDQPTAGQFAGLAYVYGEAGMGKTRLIYELRQRLTHLQSSTSNLQPLELQEKSPIEGQPAPTGRLEKSPIAWFACPAEPILRQSLHPFKHFLRGYFEQDVERSEEENKACFVQVLDALIADLKTLGACGESAAPAALKISEVVDELERTRSVLGAMVNLHWPGSLYEQLEPKLRFENSLSAFKTLTMAESLRQPVVVYVEDAHWLDADSYELVATLVRGAGDFPFVVLLAGRYGDDGSRFRVNVEAGVLELAIDLGKLAPASVQLLAERTLNLSAHQAGKQVSDELAGWLVEKTDGNPFFVEQLALDLLERGILKPDGKQWVLTQKGLAEMPASISGVLVARLDRLPARVKAVVQTAAVLGREFEVQVLAHILRNDNALPQNIKQAEAEMIWLAISEVRYLFRHALLRDAAYDMQLHARLKELHALAGPAIEHVYAADLGPHYADLAYHYGRAENIPQEFHYAQLAGEHAAAQFANQDAIRHYQKALHSAERLEAAGKDVHGQRQAIHAVLGELLTVTSQYDQAREHLSLALSLAGVGGQPDAQARACRWLARTHELRGEYPPALDWIQRGVTALEGRETAEVSEMLNTAGLIYSRQGDYDNALEQYRNCLRIAEKVNDVQAQARAYNLRGHITRLRGNSAQAIEHFERSFDLYQRAGDIRGQALAQNQLANAHFDLSQWQAAERHYGLAHRIFEQMGDVYFCAMVNNNLGGIALNQGQLDRALVFYQQGLHAAEQIGGSLWMQGGFHNNLGATYVRRGDAGAASYHLRLSQEFFERAKARDWLPELYRHKASAALLAGELAEAEAHGLQSLELACELKMRSEEGCTLRVLGQIATAQGKHTQAGEYILRSLVILEAVGDEYERARSQLAQAHLHGLQGKPRAAQAVLNECMPTFECLGAALDLAEARALREKIEQI